MDYIEEEILSQHQQQSAKDADSTLEGSGDNNAVSPGENARLPRHHEEEDRTIELEPDMTSLLAQVHSLCFNGTSFFQTVGAPTVRRTASVTELAAHTATPKDV